MRQVDGRKLRFKVHPASLLLNSFFASNLMMTTNDEVLNSWKEVATYMGRGVRTVQRWEQELGLPVRRPRGKSRSAVIAFKRELDQWLHRAPTELLQEHSEEPVHPRHPVQPAKPQRQAKLRDNTSVLIGKTKLLLSRSSDLCNRMLRLQQNVDRSLELATLNVGRTAKNLRVSIVSNLPAGKAHKGSGTDPLGSHQIIAS